MKKYFISLLVLFLAIVLWAQNPMPPVTTVSKLQITYQTTVGALPACTASTNGMAFWVTDATSGENAWGAPVTVGGSAFKLLVVCDSFGTWHTMGN